MATYILYIFMVTAAAKGAGDTHTSWVASGEYKANGTLLEPDPSTVARARKLCQDAIRALDLEPTKARCVRSQ